MHTAMNSSPEYPLKYLSYYLNKKIHSDWDEFKLGLIENTFHSPYDTIDENTGVVEVYNSETNEKDVYSFESHIRKKFEQEVDLAVNNISKGFVRRIADKDFMKRHGKTLTYQYKELVEKGVRFPFLSKYLEKIKDIINHFIPEAIELSIKSTSLDNEKIYSKRNVFQIKSNFSMRFFRKLYGIALYHNLLEEDQTSIQSFSGIYCNSYSEL